MNRFIESANAGTSAGAKKGWETRRGGASADASKPKKTVKAVAPKVAAKAIKKKAVAAKKPAAKAKAKPTAKAVAKTPVKSVAPKVAAKTIKEEAAAKAPEPKVDTEASDRAATDAASDRMDKAFGTTSGDLDRDQLHQEIREKAQSAGVSHAEMADRMATQQEAYGARIEAARKESVARDAEQTAAKEAARPIRTKIGKAISKLFKFFK